MDKTNVRKGVDIMFADGVSRTVHPLTIKSLRKFIVVINEMRNLEDMTQMTDDDIDIMVNAAEIMLEKVDPKLASDRDALEEALDLNSFAKLMDVAMGASSPEE